MIPMSTNTGNNTGTDGTTGGKDNARTTAATSPGGSPDSPDSPDSTAAGPAGAPGTLPLPPKAARALTLFGAAGTFASTMLAWTWTPDFPGDLTYYGSPVDLQTDLEAGG